MSLGPVDQSSKAISGSSVLVASLGGSSAIGRLNGGGSRVTIKTSTVLASKSKELITLGALRNLDTVLVSPGLDLAVRPGVEKRVTEALLSSGSRGGNLSIRTLGIQAGKARLTTETGNKRVASGGLGSRVTTLIEPGLDVRVGPRGIEPFAGVCSSLAELVGSGLVVFTDGPQERVALARLRDRNAILVGKSLELRVRPAGTC